MRSTVELFSLAGPAAHHKIMNPAAAWKRPSNKIHEAAKLRHADHAGCDRPPHSRLPAGGWADDQCRPSKRAGISAPPCLRRVRALEEAGVIRGYHADTDPQMLGWEITFFAIVGLESQKEAVLSAFEQLVGSLV